MREGFTRPGASVDLPSYEERRKEAEAVRQQLRELAEARREEARERLEMRRKEAESRRAAFRPGPPPEVGPSGS